MIVRDFIEELKKMPQGAEIVFKKDGEPGVIISSVKNESHIPPGDDHPLSAEQSVTNGLVVTIR